MSNLPATQSNQAVFARFAEKFGVNGKELSTILKATAFKLPAKREGDRNVPQEVSDEQMVALILVAEQYKLNPFTREIFAFPDKSKGIVPVVSVDGWDRIVNEHPQLDGFIFNFSEKLVTLDGARPCPEWIESVFYRKDRTHPIVIREYLDECYREPFKGQYGVVTGPWQTHTKRFLRHKAFIQGARMAFGFAGIYDEDEAERISSARVVNITNGMAAPIDTGPEPPALPAAESFEIVIDELGFTDQREKVEAYLTVCARHFGSGIDDVKANIIQKPADFARAFPGWLKSLESQRQAQNDGEKPAPKGGKKAAAAGEAPPAESREIECANYPGTTVRTGVECAKCKSRATDCAYWNAPGEGDQPDNPKE